MRPSRAVSRDRTEIKTGKASDAIEVHSLRREDAFHPGNAEELANVAQETGAEVLRDPLRYPGESGGWQLGDLDLGEHLAKHRDHEVVVITLYEPIPVGEKS